MATTIRLLTFSILGALLAAASLSGMVRAEPLSLGPRPLALVESMEAGPLKDRLLACAKTAPSATAFSIAHRGAPLQFPEHTAEGYVAAARMGAGVIECDVTFTSDHELVCRHAQNDLHQTTNILSTPLAANCTRPFAPATADESASALCLASDVTLAEFRKLRGKMDGVNDAATTVEAYMAGAPGWRTTGYEGMAATLVSHAESIALFQSLGAKFTPELKSPVVDMPFDGFTQADYAQKLIDEYKAAGVPPQDVWAQSFNLDDIRYWIEKEPAFGAQAVYLDGRFRSGADPAQPEALDPTMAELKAMGVNYLAPPLWMLLTLESGKIAPSAYAVAAKEAGLELIAWTLERSGPLTDGGGWYFQTIADAVDRDGDVFEVLHVLASEVGVVGVFSDWPATVTYYANCMDLS